MSQINLKNNCITLIDPRSTPGGISENLGILLSKMIQIFHKNVIMSNFGQALPTEKCHEDPLFIFRIMSIGKAKSLEIH